MTISRDAESQLLKVQPAKRFNESILQNQRDGPRQQDVSGAYDPRNVFNEASQDENRNPQVWYPGAQIHGDIEGHSLSQYSWGSCFTMQHNPLQTNQLLRPKSIQSQSKS